ncbi:MAG: hypothetical protein ACRENU_08980 [Gemmatimonadaceae bacterium]
MIVTRSALLRTAVLVLAIGHAPAARAQSNLSVQGLGYPPGQLSTQAKTMGGSIGEADALSPLNPAATGLLSSAILMFVAEPEYRTVNVLGTKQKTSVSRFPVFVGALPLGSKWAVGVSASTLLDRTWETTARDSQVIDTDTVRFTRLQSSDGSLADLRFSFAFTPWTWLKLGVAAHGITGRDVLITQQTFDDTARFAQNSEATTLSFGGHAFSAGAHALKPRLGAIGVSYRHGGRLNIYEGDNTVGRGFAPDRMGVSVIYLGIAGTALAARVARDDWSRLEGSSATLSIHEGLDVGVGADVTGPTYGGGPMSIRAGGRWRTLPFSANGVPVKEATASGGFAFPMARGDVQLNFGVLRSWRRAGPGVSETAWTYSTGFALRP